MRKKRTPKLGQHFLTGTWAAKRLVESLHIRADETILEIGPGTGALTKELVQTGALVVAIEKDASLVRSLQDTVKDAQRLQIVTADIRDFDAASLKKPYVIAANIPYYITGEIIRQFLTAGAQPRAMALLVQKEVAERIVARSGKESILSISVKAYGTPRIVTRVARSNFAPPPSVDSAILLINEITRNFFSDVDERFFFDVVRTGFAAKRKLLAGNLTKHYHRTSVLAAFAEAGIEVNSRAEDIALESWKVLASALAAAAT